MFIVISGTESSLLDQKTKEVLQKKKLLEGGVTYHDQPSFDVLRESALAQDLFGVATAHIFRELDDEVYESLFSNVQSFSQSSNILIVQVPKVLKKQKDICTDAGVEVVEVKALKEREMPSFVLADAFLRRDKKAAFTALHDELATKPPEEVHGGLWYQMKNMALIFSGATEEESGLHPFVYKKIKSASAKFSKKECDEILKTLLEMNHKAHRGEVDFETALEQFVLKFI
ncbi:MAG: hypothetical protein WAV09_01325 [Minisyncoccia bacterium]